MSGRVAAHPLRELHHAQSYDHIHRSSADMGIRDMKKLKYLLARNETKSDRAGSGTGVERVDSGDSLARPVPHVAAGGDSDRGEDGDEAYSNWKSTTSAAAKLLLRGVKDSAAVFGPLQSVAGGLCFILENCEVLPFPA